MTLSAEATTVQIALEIVAVKLPSETYMELLSDYVDDLDSLRAFIAEHPEAAERYSLRKYLKLLFPVHDKDRDSGLLVFTLEEFLRFLWDCVTMNDLVLLCQAYIQGLTSGGSGPGIHDSCRE